MDSWNSVRFFDLTIGIKNKYLYNKSLNTIRSNNLVCSICSNHVVEMYQPYNYNYYVCEQCFPDND